MRKLFVVIGATGNVGIQIAKNLIRQRYNVRLGVRNVEKAEKFFGDNAECMFFDYTKPETFLPLLKNCTRLFMILPDDLETAGRHPLHHLVNVAIERCVERIVFLSVIRTGTTVSTPPHYDVEEYLVKEGINHCILRPNWFMQNFSTVFQDQIRNGQLFLPAGSGKTTFIDIRDIAALGSRCMELDKIEGNPVYELTGCESIDHFTVAQHFTNVLKKRVVYLNPTPEVYGEKLKAKGVSDEEIEMMIYMYEPVRDGEFAIVTDTVKNTLGRDPIKFAQFVEDYKDVWL